MDEIGVNLEKALLAAILRASDEVRSEMLDSLGAQHFADSRHRALFRAVSTLHADAHAIDAVSLGSELKTQKSRVDPSYAAEIIERPGTDIAWQSLAAQVRKHAAFRELLSIANDAQQVGFAKLGDPIEALERVARHATEVAAGHRRVDLKTAADAIDEASLRMEAIRNGDAGAVGLLTGLPELDAMLCGLHPGELVIVAAGASVGKSALGMTIGVNVARTGRPVLLVSLEMSGVQIGQRLLSFESNISASGQMRPEFLLKSQWEKLAIARQKMRSVPLFLTDQSDMTLGAVRSQARLCQRSNGLSMLIVDYLQLMEGSGKYGNRERDVAEISRGLKMLAKELQIPVVALAQINREASKRTGDASRPMLSDLRESGAIEQDADKVVMIWRNTAEGRDSEAEILVRKNRNGPTGKIDANYVKEAMRFEEFRRFTA